MGNGSAFTRMSTVLVAAAAAISESFSQSVSADLATAAPTPMVNVSSSAMIFIRPISSENHG
jgi:hypothetical protein